MIDALFFGIAIGCAIILLASPFIEQGRAFWRDVWAELKGTRR
jgi:hypothetical protein